MDPLKRMLANGPLTGLPKRPTDQALLTRLASSQFEPGREYREKEVNETLVAWLQTFCEPYGIDHVTMRRMLVDSRLLLRDRQGSTYRLNPATAERLDAEPARVLAGIEVERKARKEKHHS